MMHTAIRAVRRQIFENVVRPARRAWRRGGAAFSFWARPENNPFLSRAVRTEARRGRPLLVLLLAAILIAALIGFAWFYFNDDSGNGKYAGFARTYWMSGPSWGGNVVGFFAIATALVSALVVMYATRVRAASLLREEMLRGTLDQLQLLPVAEERWLWQMSAHLVLTALCVFSMGLPIYMLAVFSGVWRAQDVLGMALFFALLGYAAPAWNPIMWRAAAKKAPDPKTMVKWNDAIRLSGINNPDLTPAQKMEAQRRFQRLISGLEDGRVNVNAAAPNAATNTNATSAAPGMAAQNGVAADANGAASTRNGQQTAVVAMRAGAGPKSSGGGCVLWGFVFLVLAFISGIVSVTGGNAFTRIWNALIGGLWRGFRDAWPESVKELIGAGFFFSWPLLAARVLVAPVPFFSIRVPFALLLLPLLVAMWRQANITLASRVSTSETFWTPRRARVQQGAGTASLVVILLIVVGMTWREIIGNGTLGDLLQGAIPATGASARSLSMAAAWTLALVVATLYAARKLELPFARAGRGNLAPREAWRQSALVIARVAAVTAMAYFAMSWFGGVAGVSSAWWQRLVPTLITAAAFLLAAYGSAAVQAQLRGFPQTLFRVVRFLWFWGFLAEVAMRVSTIAANNAPATFGAMTGTPAAKTAALPGFAFDQAPHVLLSPMVTLLALFRTDLSPAISAQKAAWWPAAFTHVPWWLGPLAQSLLGLALILAAAPSALKGGIRAAGDGSEAAASLWRRILRVLAAPFAWLASAFDALWTALSGLFGGLSTRIRRINEVVIARAFSYDNAVLTAEVRRKARRTNWALHWLLSFVFGALLFLVPVLLWIINVTGAAPPTPHIGAGVVYVTLGGAALIAWLAVSDGGLSFDRDRADGTLIFLFLTPLTDADILKGKTWVQFAYALPILLSATPWLLLGSVGALFEGEAAPLFLALCGFPAVLSILYFAVHTQVLCAVRAKKPTEGAAKAMLACIVVELVLWMVVGALGVDSGSFATGFALLFVAAIHVGLGYAAWLMALKSMHAIRYGDVKAGGKVAA